MEYSVRLAEPGDLDAWFAYDEREALENGADGVYFSPYSPTQPRAPRPRAQWLERMALPIDAPDWMRAWLALTPRDGAVAGYCRLIGPKLASEAHRCTMAIGLGRAHRGRGVGSALLATAIAWAREQPGLDWMDLGVFDGNAPAHALYRKFGFAKQGYTPDRFRVDGHSIGDTQMALRLRAEAS